MLGEEAIDSPIFYDLRPFSTSSALILHRIPRIRDAAGL